jgi:hypothetical protein
MTRAQAKAIHHKVNSLLNTLELEHTMDGSLPHCNVVCVVRYEPHGASTKDEDHEEEAWKHRKKKEASAEDGPAKAGPTPAKSGLNPG